MMRNGFTVTPLGMKAKTKRILVGLAGAAAVGIAAIQLAPQPQESAVQAGAPGSAPKSERSSSVFASLPAREAMGKRQGELFGPQSWAPPVPVASRRVVEAPPPKPTAPPFPYKIAGLVAGDEGSRVVLSKGDRVFEVTIGQTLEEGFRLESVSPHALKFVYVPLGETQEMPVIGLGLDLTPVRTAVAAPGTGAAPAAAGASGAAAAQLRFEGPQEVRAGTPFDVALKLTSTQAVRSMPMQLTYDAKRLQPMAVRAGDLFAGGSFSYRVNPSGSIFVGASGSGRTATNADSLIVTFRPIASGAAELKVSSLLLQGATGNTIAHEPPAAFHAAILQ
jgi:hypothetical protein